MSVFIRRTSPIWLAAIVAVLMNVEYFFNTPQGSWLASTIRNWGMIAAAFTYVLATAIMTILHGRMVQKKMRGQWYYSIILLASLWGMAVWGITMGPSSEAYVWIYSNVVLTVYSCMLGTTGFFVTSAAYRAFRARSGEAAVMLVFCAIVMLSQATIGELIWSGFVPLGQWVINVPMSAGGRGLQITIAFGFITLCLRIMSGFETRWLGD